MADLSSSLSALIDRARNGSADALATLLQTYRSYLALLARLQISRRLQGRVSPSDVVQDTFLWAKRAFPEFRGTTEMELTAWLRKILASQLAIVVRHHRAQRRDVRLEQQLHDELEQSSLTLSNALPVDLTSPSQQALKREQAVLLAEALARMPNDYREVIVLRHLESRSFAEVAELLHRSIPSVKSIWTRAIRKLRSELQEAVP